MKRSGPQIISILRESTQLGVGRHLYGVLGSYQSLARFEQRDLTQASFLDGKTFPEPVNLNKSLLERIGDDDLKNLVQNEARLPQAVQRRLNREFDLLLLNCLQETNILILKQIELLFAYQLDLHVIRARATNQKHILLLLPGEKRGDQIALFSEANPRFHRTLPPQLITENHLWELSDVE